MSAVMTSEQLLDALVREVAQATVEMVRDEHVSTDDAYGKRQEIAAEMLAVVRACEVEEPYELTELSARLRRLELLERAAVLRCGHETTELEPMKDGTYCNACLAALAAQATPTDSRLYAAAPDLLAELTAVEWAGLEDHPDGGHYGACPSCGGGDPDNPATPADHAGHAEGCTLAAAIRRATGGPRP